MAEGVCSAHNLFTSVNTMGRLNWELLRLLALLLSSFRVFRAFVGDYMGVPDIDTKIPWRRELGLSGVRIHARRAGYNHERTIEHIRNGRTLLCHLS